MANGPKERVNGAIRLSQKHLLRIKAKTWNTEQLSQTKREKKGEGGQQLIAGQFKIDKIAVK